MKRLTEWYGEHAAVVDHHTNYIDRLAEYEDSGMTPAEFREAASTRPQGEWIEDEPYLCEDGYICFQYRCSLCGRYEDEKEPYCNCGAKMR